MKGWIVVDDTGESATARIDAQDFLPSRAATHAHDVDLSIFPVFTNERDAQLFLEDSKAEFKANTDENIELTIKEVNF